METLPQTPNRKNSTSTNARSSENGASDTVRRGASCILQHMKILEQDTSQLPPAIWLPKVKLEGCFTNPLLFHAHLLTFEYVDIASYTISLSLKTARCVLFTKSSHPLVKHDGISYIQVENLHVKLAVCYNDDKPVTAFVGSMNFVRESDLIDVMMPVPSDRLDAVVLFYNTLFERAYEQCHKTS